MSAFGRFGSSPAAPSPFASFAQNKPSVFGSTSTPTSSAFGAFGQQNQQNNAQQPAQQPQQQSNPFGSFGATAPTTTPAPAFGTSTSATAPPSTTTPAFGGGTMGGTGNIFGSFGAATASNNPSGQQQQQQPPSTTSTFGTTPAPPSGAQPTTESNMFGSFGQTQNQPNTQQPPTSTNIFGKPTAPAFGAPAATTGPFSGSSNLFGSTATAQPSVPPNATTAQPTTNMFASSGVAAASQTGRPADMSSVEAQLKAVHDAWDSSSPNCKFQYFFYNLVDEAEVHMYGRPTTAANEVLWQKAVRDNPLPSRLVPVHAIGFEDLKKRIAVQKAQTEAQLAGMKILKTEITKMTEAHTLKISPRLSILSHAQADLQSRITKLIHHLHLFIPSIRSMPIRPDEELLRNKLEAIEAELRGPGGLGRVGGRVGELWGLVGRIKASRDAGRTSLDREGGWAVVDERAFEDMKQILAEEQQGLKFVTELLRTALDDVNWIKAGLDEMPVT